MTKRLSTIWKALPLLAALLLATPALAQENPTLQEAAEASNVEPGASEMASTSVGEDALENPEDAAAARATLEAERNALIDNIILETGIPAQHDTGFAKTDAWGGWGWMPQNAAARAGETDFIFYFIMWVTVIFTVIVVAVMAWFLIRYRARSDDEPDPTNVTTHSTSLEITWTVIPTCIVLVMFVLGFRGYLNDTIAPPSAKQIDVLGSSWVWNFTYPNGAQTSDLHLKVGEPVQFTLKSQDVIHSFFVPAFRIKKDVVPGRFNSTWVTPTTPGVFELFCTEYCGTGHSEMVAKVFVYPEDKYDAMLARISDIYTDFATGEPKPPAEVGKAIWAARGCQGCHSADGSAGTGPTWRNLWNAPNHTMADGTVVEVDENYITESIWYPQRQIVAGYGNAMPSYLGQLDDRDIASVIAYLKTISEYSETAPAEPTGKGGMVTDEESTSIDGGDDEDLK